MANLEIYQPTTASTIIYAAVGSNDCGTILRRYGSRTEECLARDGDRKSKLVGTY